VSKAVTPSVWDISRRGSDLQRQHAQRLLLSGYDVESAATLSRLPVDQVREIARASDLEIKPTRP
jgi:hypothetical protein